MRQKPKDSKMDKKTLMLQAIGEIYAVYHDSVVLAKRCDSEKTYFPEYRLFIEYPQNNCVNMNICFLKNCSIVNGKNRNLGNDLVNRMTSAFENISDFPEFIPLSDQGVAIISYNKNKKHF